jgi:hypothetical protein
MNWDGADPVSILPCMLFAKLNMGNLRGSLKFWEEILCFATTPVTSIMGYQSTFLGFQGSVVAATIL